MKLILMAAFAALSLLAQDQPKAGAAGPITLTKDEVTAIGRASSKTLSLERGIKQFDDQVAQIRQKQVNDLNAAQQELNDSVLAAMKAHGCTIETCDFDPATMELKHKAPAKTEAKK